MIKLFQDETTKAIVRKHWLILFRDSLGLMIFYIVPFIAYWYFFDISTTPKIIMNQIYTNPPTSVLVFAVSAWTLIAWVKFFAIWIDYYLDVWFVTDKRIIDIEQKGFFKREISTFRMERIQDVTVEVDGIIQTLFNIGNIHVQTAGESEEFIINGISNPKKIKEIIMRQSDKVVK